MGELGMNTPSRLAGLCAGLALLLAACGEPTPEAEQQGSVSPAAIDQAQATDPTTEGAQT
jgi:hypothetical protein